MGVAALREQYLEVFGEPSGSGNKAYLFKKLAWRLQSLAEGGLSERAKRRAEELVRDADLRTNVRRPPPPPARPPPANDSRRRGGADRADEGAVVGWAGPPADPRHRPDPHV